MVYNSCMTCTLRVNGKEIQCDPADKYEVEVVSSRGGSHTKVEFRLTRAGVRGLRLNYRLLVCERMRTQGRQAATARMELARIQAIIAKHTGREA